MRKAPCFKHKLKTPAKTICFGKNRKKSDIHFKMSSEFVFQIFTTKQRRHHNFVMNFSLMRQLDPDIELYQILCRHLNDRMNYRAGFCVSMPAYGYYV